MREVKKIKSCYQRWLQHYSTFLSPSVGRQLTACFKAIRVIAIVLVREIRKAVAFQSKTLPKEGNHEKFTVPHTFA